MSEFGSTIDLSNCDREPIHIPGSVQPHGVLLVVEPETTRILQVAGDTQSTLGRDIDAILGECVTDVVGGYAASLIDAEQGSRKPGYLGSFTVAANARRSLDLTRHDRDGILVLEIEPSSPRTRTAGEVLARVRWVAAKLERATDLPRLLQSAAREARRLTGFDRVMIYRFLCDGAGSVEAEDKIDKLDPFLNHRYPASDIPKQARALYLQNLLRVIPDVDYTPAPLVPALNPMTNAPLDMSECALRSVSPIHLQYLKNMGVRASMSVSIVVDGALWGLIAFHHTSPMLVPYEVREVCKHVAQILGQQVRAREQDELHQQRLRFAAAREELVDSLSKASVIEHVLLECTDELQRALPADGAAVRFGDRISRTGHAPSGEQIRELTEWLLRVAPNDPYETNSLVRQYAPAAAYAAEASGLLATVVCPEEPLMLLWFRAEQLETINWAGNPHKAAELAGAGTLTPRKSFEIWKEIVHQQCRAWSTAEVDAGGKLGRALCELLQQQRLRELNVQLRRTLSDKEALLAQKDLLMQEVHHRVQNSLQLVNAMLNLQARQAGGEPVKGQFDEASRRIMAISMVHQRLWRADHIQSVDFASYLEELRDGLVETWGQEWVGRIKVHGAHVRVPTNTAVVLALVITELLTNAVKYAYEGRPGPIDVKLMEAASTLHVVVKDQGIGVGGREPSPSGLGSRLTRALIHQLEGELRVATGTPGTSIHISVPLTKDVSASKNR
jgi:two-component system, chemotaxis family, sensor kinase Cph1